MGITTDSLVGGLALPMIADFPESLILLDTTNKIIFINTAAREKLHITPATVETPVDLERILAKDEAVRLSAHLKDSGSYKSDESKLITGDGSELCTSCHVSTIRDEEGRALGAVMLLGVAAHGRLNEYAKRLENKVKELDQFSYIVSHDLKAPLRAIANLTNWIEEDLQGTLSGDTKKNMQMLISRVGRMEALINGILEYSRVGRIEVKSELVDVHILLTEILESLAPPSNVSVKIVRNMPSMMAPGILLSQVFTNLISNAIKHNDKEDPLINIGVEESDNEFTFFVQDNGPGIAKEHHEKIFVIFQTLQSRDKFESTGIGLTIVKRIIEEQGGRIWVESSPGMGSKFFFTWASVGEPV